MIAGKVAVIAGYGDVGKGSAQAMRADDKRGQRGAGRQGKRGGGDARRASAEARRDLLAQAPFQA